MSPETYKHIIDNNLNADQAKSYIEKQYECQRRNAKSLGSNAAFVPFASVSLNYIFNETFNAGLKFTYSPKVEGFGSIGGFHIIFSYVYLGFEF